MNQVLRTVFSSSSGTAKAYAVKGFTTYGKSGTTTNNYDRWCIGGTPYYIAAVWFGYDYNKQIMASGSPAGQIFKTVMDRVHDGLAAKQFDQFSDKVVQRNYCTVSGLLASSSCGSTATGWYKSSNLPATCAGCRAPGGSSSSGETTETTTGSTEDTTSSTEGTTAAPPPATEAPPPPAEPVEGA